MNDSNNSDQVDRIDQQLHFLLEIDRLKSVERRTLIADGSRHENSAEHSWHLAMMALLFAGSRSSGEIDRLKVLMMLLVHDIVEVDAGDTFCYDVEATQDQEEREQRAADRLFGLLPADQGQELKSAWREFEDQATPEALLANALDRLQPLLMNCSTEGHSWKKHRIRRQQVVQRMMPIREGLPDLWSRVEARLDEAVDRGWLLP